MATVAERARLIQTAHIMVTIANCHGNKWSVEQLFQPAGPDTTYVDVPRSADHSYVYDPATETLKKVHHGSNHSSPATGESDA